MTKRGEYVPGPKEPYNLGRHQTRCNKRSCQARRNLTKHPALYKRWPICHLCGEGKMYVDWYRMNRGPKDNPAVCRDLTCSHYRETGNLVPYHRVNSKGCSGYHRYVSDRNIAPRSKHSPILEKDWVPF